jgi:hypothetical protein
MMCTMVDWSSYDLDGDRHADLEATYSEEVLYAGWNPILPEAHGSAIAPGVALPPSMQSSAQVPDKLAGDPRS